jgi:hypothetical protein
LVGLTGFNGSSVGTAARDAFAVSLPLGDARGGLKGALSAAAAMPRHELHPAVQLQAWWRMTVLRRAYVEARMQWLRMKDGVDVADNDIDVQGPGGGPLPATWLAAVAIQNCWRGYMSTRIFRYYRDLISFQERGMPNQLLRCVNPAEARLLDAASRTHVRFRLGGASFPPTIYYKVFVHGGLLDIGSFAPRDYTEEGSKKMAPRHSVRPGDMLPDHDHDGWYRRLERNNWRPMSMKLVEEGLDLHLGRGTVQQQVFHHSKSLRKDEQERRKRTKKRDWLQKMYTPNRCPLPRVFFCFC